MANYITLIEREVFNFAMAFIKIGTILCVEKELIINRERNIYFREKNNLFSDKYFD
jgi:lipoprotein signal peptidase